MSQSLPVNTNVNTEVSPPEAETVIVPVIATKISTPADLNRLKYYRLHVQMGTIFLEAKENMFKQAKATGKKLDKLKKEHTELVAKHKQKGIESCNMQKTILNDIAKGDF